MEIKPTIFLGNLDNQIIGHPENTVQKLLAVPPVKISMMRKKTICESLFAKKLVFVFVFQNVGFVHTHLRSCAHLQVCIFFDHGLF